MVTYTAFLRNKSTGKVRLVERGLRKEDAVAICRHRRETDSWRCEFTTDDGYRTMYGGRGVPHTRVPIPHMEHPMRRLRPPGILLERPESYVTSHPALIRRAWRALSEREDIALDVIRQQGLRWDEVFRTPEVIADVANEMIVRGWPAVALEYVTPEDVKTALSELS